MALHEPAGSEQLPSPGETIEQAVRFLEATSGRWFADSRVPRLIHQTWKVSDPAQFPDAIRAAVASFASRESTTLRLIWSDQACAEFVGSYHPSLATLFGALPHAVMRADLFRYMVLSSFGGVYSDVDTYLLKPVDQWASPDAGAPPVSAIVGIEADPDRPDWASWYPRRLQWCQWTIASAAGHPILRYVIEESERRIRAGVESSIMELTGPGVWTDSVNRWLEHDQGRHWREFLGLESAVRVGDALILPITGFSPGVGHMGAKPISAAEALVEHRFMGSWKPAEQRD